MKQYLIHYQTKDNLFGFYWLDAEEELIAEKNKLLSLNCNIFYAGKIEHLQLFSTH